MLKKKKKSHFGFMIFIQNFESPMDLKNLILELILGVLIVFFEFLDNHHLVLVFLVSIHLLF